MANYLGVPGISPRSLAEKRLNGNQFVLLDVRELYELAKAKLEDPVVVVPLSKISQEYEDALPVEIRENRDSEIIVMCHHGIRSAQVTEWMRANSYSNVWNLDGGIEAYAVEVDPSVGRY